MAGQEPLYNILVPVQARLRGADPEKARARLVKALERAGFDVFTEGIDPDATFLDEEQDAAEDPLLNPARVVGYGDYDSI